MCIKAETHDATNRLVCTPAATRLCAYLVAAICRTNSNQFEFMRQIAATIIFTCHTGRFVAATCHDDVSQRFFASCVSAFTYTSVRHTVRKACSNKIEQGENNALFYVYIRSSHAVVGC